MSQIAEKVSAHGDTLPRHMHGYRPSELLTMDPDDGFMMLVAPFFQGLEARAIREGLVPDGILDIRGDPVEIRWQLAVVFYGDDTGLRRQADPETPALGNSCQAVSPRLYEASWGCVWRWGDHVAFVHGLSVTLSAAQLVGQHRLRPSRAFDPLVRHTVRRRVVLGLKRSGGAGSKLHRRYSVLHK